MNLKIGGVFFCLFAGILCLPLAQSEGSDATGVISGQVKTLAGGQRIAGFMDGRGIAARFNTPYGITSDMRGKFVYVVDTVNQVIRKVDTFTREVVTIAGSAGKFGSIDGTGSEARFLYPGEIVMNPQETALFISDSGNNTIRKIVLSSGIVTTIAGTAGTSGAIDAVGPLARFNFPFGLAIDGSGNHLYIADKNNHAIREMDLLSGSVTTLVGGGSPGYGDGFGPGARFAYPQGIALDRSGKILYVADTNNQCIRQIQITEQEVTTLAGSPGNFGSNDGQGSYARFFNPQGITMDRSGSSLFVTDTSNHTIRKISIANGFVSTFAGSPLTSKSRDGINLEAGFNSPSGITAGGPFIFLMDYAENIVRQISQ